MTVWLLWSGLTQPDGFVMSFASAGIEHTILRSVILVSLVAILFSRPPRSRQFRALLGSVSALVLLVACASMADYQIGVLDAILYFEVSVILAIEAIEPHRAPVNFSAAPSLQS